MENNSKDLEFNELSENGKQFVYLLAHYGAVIHIYETGEKNKILVKMHWDKSVTIIMDALELKKFIDSKCVSTCNRKISSAGRVVIMYNDLPDDEYDSVHNRDDFDSAALRKIKAQHPILAEESRKLEEKKMAIIEKQKQRELEEKRLEEEKRRQEEEFLKTPKGKIVNIGRKMKEGISNGIYSFANAMDQFSRDLDDVMYESAKARRKSGAYIGDLGNRNVQRTSDDIIVAIGNYRKGIKDDEE